VAQYNARVAAERASQAKADDADADAVRSAAPEARPYVKDAPALTV
jgi:glycerol-3-phosphate dehydrogenase